MLLEKKAMTELEIFDAIKHFRTDDMSIVRQLLGDSKNKILIESLILAGLQHVRDRANSQQRRTAKIAPRKPTQELKEIVKANMVTEAEKHIEKINSYYKKSVLYLWKVHGKPLGDCTGKEIAKAMSMDQTKANGYLNNVDFYKAILRKIGASDVCKDKLSIEQAEKIREGIYGKESTITLD